MPTWVTFEVIKREKVEDNELFHRWVIFFYYIIQLKDTFSLLKGEILLFLSTVRGTFKTNVTESAEESHPLGFLNISVFILQVLFLSPCLCFYKTLESEQMTVFEFPASQETQVLMFCSTFSKNARIIQFPLVWTTYKDLIVRLLLAVCFHHHLVLCDSRKCLCGGRFICGLERIWRV